MTGFDEVEIERVGARTIPGYFREQRSRAHLKSMLRIRGPLAAPGGLAIDALAWLDWARGQLEYILEKART